MILVIFCALLSKHSWKLLNSLLSSFLTSTFFLDFRGLFLAFLPSSLPKSKIHTEDAGYDFSPDRSVETYSRNYMSVETCSETRLLNSARFANS